MLDKNFSLLSFQNEMESDGLSKQLENKIQVELHKVIQPKLEELISDLNSLGHNLTLYYPAESGDISYRDESGGKCMLRVSSDLVVSVGFSDTVDE